jgi:uncharacterized protein YjbJ (UPF0337 family)
MYAAAAAPTPETLLNYCDAGTFVLQAFAQRSSAMGSFTDKIRGYFNEVAGKSKQSVGKAVGDDRLRAKGLAQEAKGDAQETVGNVKGALKDSADRVSEAAHRKL